MYGKPFLDRYKQKLELSETFADKPDLQQRIFEMCVRAVFICVNPETIEGRTQINKEFVSQCTDFFIDRAKHHAPQPLPEVSKYDQKINKLNHENHLLDQQSFYLEALSLFLDNMMEEGRGPNEGMTITPNGLIIT